MSSTCGGIDGKRELGEIRCLEGEREQGSDGIWRDI
jgi:hypothetical protein